MKSKIFILVLIVYLLYNLSVMIVYGMDKHYAKKDKWRIPEKTLVGLAFFFGGPGAFLGMQIFRHKTKHLQFQILVPIFMILQIIIWVVVANAVLY
ncbi:MAG: DUF1294 domain-containing protein [Lachnospiraceae bacterium]|nr:DUF1294 domain-containing protein [Lachnospiraceae bacterium]